MSILKKKIAAILMTATLSVFLVGPGVAEALTAAELQVQIDALMAQLASLQAQLSDLEDDSGTPAVSGCTITNFDRNLKQGMSGDDVKCLQVVLNSAADTQLASSGVGSSGNETTYFGPLTKAAVVKFQEKYAEDVLAYWGLTAGTGFVGSTTRAKLNEFLTGEEEPTPAGCDCTAWVNDVCGGGACAATEMNQTRTCTPAACAAEAKCVADTSCEAVTPSAAAVSKAADSPAAGSVAGQAQDVPFLKLKFTAGSTAYTVSKVIVARGGTSSDADLSSLKIFDGDTRLGSAQALNTNTHKATFSGLSWEIPANSTKYLTVKGTINQIASGYATTGNSVQLGVSVASDITATAELAGSFPIWSAAKTIAGISVGVLDVDEQTTPADATILSGSTEQEIAAWKFEASSTEGFSVQSITVTQVGSATSDDVTNIKLKYVGTQLGETVAELTSSGKATFDLSSEPFELNASTSKIVYAYADIGSGISTSRTVIFEITEYTDVTAYGSNSGGSVTVTCDSDADSAGGDSFVKQTGNTMTIGQGTLTISLDNAQNPSAQTYVKGTSDRLITALKFSTGSREGVRITELKLTLTGTATDISNVTLWDGTTQIAGPASAIGSYVTFGTNTVGWDEPGVVDIAASTNKSLLVKADIPSGATADNEIVLSVSAATNVKADGSSSQYDIPSASITGTATGSTHTIGGKGNLTVSLASTAPSSQTYVKGATGKKLTAINFTADSGEDVVLSSLTVKAYASTDTATALTSGDISNVKLCHGVTEVQTGEFTCETQLGSTVSSGTSSMSFSGSLTVAASSTETLFVLGNIPTTTTASYINIDVRDVATYTTDITSTGVASSAAIVETGSADGNYMTVGTGALTFVAAPSPADQPVIINATDISYLGIVMTAGTAEDVRVTLVKLARTGADNTIGGTAYDGDAASDNDISNIALYDSAGTRLTTKKNLSSAAVTFSASDFVNSTGIDIVKGQQATVYVKADAPATATSGKCNALGVPNTSSGSYYTYVAATGLSSGASLTTTDITITAGPSSCSGGVNYVADGHADCYQVGLASAGALSVSENAGRPDTARVAVGNFSTDFTSHSFYKVDMKATYESVDVKSVNITRPDTCGDGDDVCGRDATFYKVELYDGEELLGSQNMVSGDITFNFPADSYWRVPNGVTKTLTVKGTLNGIAYNATLPGDYPKLCLAADGLTVQGVDSGSTSVTITGNDSALCSQEQSLATSVPTITVGSLPSTGLVPGENTMYKWTVSADAQGPIVWGRVAFSVTGQASQDGTMRTIGTDDTTTDRTDGIYTIYTADGNADKKTISSLAVYKGETSPTQVAGTFYYRTDTDAGAGTVLVFKPTTAEEVAAGESKTYTLKGVFTLVSTSSGTLGSVSTKISNLSSIYDADLSSSNYQRASLYATVVKNAAGTSEDASYTDTDCTNNRSFVWSDKSGCVQAACTAQTTHAATTYDWFGDYKVMGVPTTTLTLSQ